MYIDFAKFILLVLLIIFPIGKIILDLLKIRLNFWEEVLFSINIGIVFVTLTTFLLGLLGHPRLVLVLAWLPLLYLFIRKGKQRIIKFKIRIPNLDLLLILILLFCTFVQSIITFSSGDMVGNSIRLMGIHDKDSLWYIALINSLEKSIPPQSPIFSGQMIQNYHYFTFIFVAFLKSITNIPIMVLYFKLFIPLLVFLFSAAVFVFVKNLTDNKWAGYLAVLITALASNFYYLIGFLYPSAIVTPSVFWVDEYTTRMVNPQLLLSYIILITMLYLLLNVKRISDYKFIIIFSILAGSLIGFKSFAAAVFLSALAVLSLFRMAKRNFSYIKILVSSILMTLIFYVNSVRNYQPIFIFSPFWFIKTMFESGDHLNFDVWELKRQTYLNDKNIIRVIQLYAQGLVIFLVGNLGTRLLGIIALFQAKSERKKDMVYLLFLISIIGFVIAMLTIFRGITWNSIQFFYYTVMFSAILTAVSIAGILKRNILIGVLLCVCT